MEANVGILAEHEEDVWKHCLQSLDGSGIYGVCKEAIILKDVIATYKTMKNLYTLMLF